MSLPDRTTVLIVGAGPTGLATAVSLLHHDFHDFVIVDSLPQGGNLSRAMIIHAATLEVLDTVGCGDDIASQGIKASTLDSETRSTKLCSINVGGLKPYTRHPYVLAISQDVTERILEEKLAGFGVNIHRPLKVVGLTRNAKDPQLSDAMFEDGRVITVKYVIGADGAHSSIRSLTGIGFSDPTFVKGEENNNLAQMIIADVTFDNIIDDIVPGPISTFSPNSLFLCSPLPSSFNKSHVGNGQVSSSDRVYRIGCGVPLEEGEIPHSPSQEYIQTLVDRFGPHRLSSDPSVNPRSKPTQIKQMIWSSRFRNRASVADSTFVRLGAGESGDGGAVILVGDAAHVHSPAGGQGMNLCLRDAVFLGEALTKHIRAAETEPLSEADTILHEFATTRHARALEVIKLTKRVLSMEGLKYREKMYWWLPIDSEAFRRWVFWIIERLPFVQNMMAWELSGLGRK